MAKTKLKEYWYYPLRGLGIALLYIGFYAFYLNWRPSMSMLLPYSLFEYITFDFNFMFFILFAGLITGFVSIALSFNKIIYYLGMGIILIPWIGYYFIQSFNPIYINLFVILEMTFVGLGAGMIALFISEFIWKGESK